MAEVVERRCDLTKTTPMMEQYFQIKENVLQPMKNSAAPAKKVYLPVEMPLQVPQPLFLQWVRDAQLQKVLMNIYLINN